MGSIAVPEKIRVAIVGGGIAGLCLAVALNKYENIDCHVYETQNEYHNVGAGMALHANAIRAMELIDLDIKQGYFRSANSMVADDEKEITTSVLMAQGSHQGEVIAHLGRAKGRKTVARNHLLKNWQPLIPSDKLHFNKRLDNLEESNNVISLHFKDGSTATADCLIGCDGVHSQIRKYLLGDHPATEPVNHDRWYRWGANIPAERAKGLISEKWFSSVPIMCGPEGYAAVLNLDYGKTLSIGVCRQESFPGEKDQPPSPELFKGYTEDFVNIVKLVNEQPENHWDFLDHDPAPFYAKGNVVMIGDAAHATMPFNGNGAAQAIEDAAVLSALFAHVQTKSQIPTALSAFDVVRRPRSQRVVEIAREFGRMYNYDFGDVQWKDGDDIQVVKDHFWKLAAFTNDADLQVQNDEAIKIYKENIAKV